MTHPSLFRDLSDAEKGTLLLAKHRGLQLGVPSGENSHRLFNVPWPLAKVVIEAYLAAQHQIVAALNAKALIEAAA